MSGAPIVRASSGGWLTAGLGLAALATLMLEVLDTRLLSVVTWYHLSFFAVSMAMLGMAAGAVLVFVGGPAFEASSAARALPRAALLFAVLLPVSHVGNLVIPFTSVADWPAAQLAAMTMSTVVLAAPFVVSGVVITLALTRSGGPVGRLYGADLIGAALGCVLIVVALDFADLTSGALGAGVAAALAAWCFARWAGRRGRAPIVLAAALVLAGIVNANLAHPLGPIYLRSRHLWFLQPTLDYYAWNSHSYVIVEPPVATNAFLWGGSEHAPMTPTRIAWAAIDGQAGTPITEWDGQPASLEWTKYDVTALPYRLRNGRAAVIGVGGGRDVLTAIAFGNSPVTGIEINGTLVDALRGRYRAFTKIVDAPGVTLVHDEARSYLTRTDERFDVLQMSLIDTWAATGAGAFTLTENGLYTREGWRVFLNTLAPDGVFSVSRWFDPATVSETTRLLALGARSLMDSGIAAPRGHILLVTQGRVATLMVSRQPFTDADRAAVHAAARDLGFTLQVTPWDEPRDSRLGAIAAATRPEDIATAVEDRDYDFSPPSDARPYFFNMLKPGAILRSHGLRDAGVVAGNLRATMTLLALFGVSAVLVGAVVVWPLVQAGRPELPGPVFAAALTYFAIIGFGFMGVQIPMLQRFSVYLGHPTYTFSIVLFLMILAAGFGSLVSDRLRVASGPPLALPLGIGAAIVVETWLLQPAIAATMGWPLAGRSLIVALFLAPLAFAMGMCFPVGMRLVGRHSDRITAWMWGVNGACGVLASILAVMSSMWLGIDTSLWVAAALYALLAVPMRRLARA